MTSTVDTAVARAGRRAAVRALRAPSVHNSQPWKFVHRRGGFEVHADRSRQLRVLDPRGRQLLMSCGCAVLNARVAFAAAGVGVDVVRERDPYRPDLVARLIATEGSTVDEALAALDPYVDLRRTNRRRFADEAVPEDDLHKMVDAARTEGAQVHVVRTTDERLAVARLSQMADRMENADPAYRAELRSWTTDDPRREDGVQAFSVPHVDGSAHDDIPIRDFDTRGTGWLPSGTHSSAAATLVLLGTDSDHHAAWARAGEALERMLLECTRLGFAASPLTQIIEVPHTQALLRAELGITMFPHIMMRIGRAPETAPTRRRRLADVLSEQPDEKGPLQA